MLRGTVSGEVLSRALADLIEKELGAPRSQSSNTVDEVVGLGLRSDYVWEGEDLVEALRRRANVPDRC